MYTATTSLLLTPLPVALYVATYCPALSCSMSCAFVLSSRWSTKHSCRVKNFVSSSDCFMRCPVLQTELRFVGKQQVEHQAQLQHEQELLEANFFTSYNLIYHALCCPWDPPLRQHELRSVATSRWSIRHSCNLNKIKWCAQSASHCAVLFCRVLQQELRFVRKQQMEHQTQLQREQELLEADPFDPEAQRRIEELIQQKNIEENFMAVGCTFAGCTQW